MPHCMSSHLCTRPNVDYCRRERKLVIPSPQGDSKENALDHTQAGLAGEDVSGHVKNNYVRPEGQNVGNFLTGRSSSRVLAPPGGFTNITFG